MKRILFAVLSLSCLGNAAANCLQTFNVKANSTVSDYAWVPGTGVLTASPISCVTFEKARQRLFVSGQGKIDPAYFANVSKYESEVSALSARIAKTKVELDKKLQSDATVDAIIIPFEIILYDLSKAMTLIGCFAPEPTMVTKVGCGIGLIGTAKETYSIVSGGLTKQQISDRAKQLTADIAAMEKARAALLAKKGQFQMDTSTKQLNAVFLNMCEAVKKSCL
jgi:hypothetical protein